MVTYHVKGNWINSIITILGVIVICVIAVIGTTIKEKEIITIVNNRYVVNMDVNEEVECLIGSGKSEEVYSFYDGITNSRNVTYHIVSSALLYSVPVHYAMAEASVESCFNSNAVNVNWNGSRDIGLFQLNEYSFPNYVIGELLDIKTNCKLACETLKGNRNKYGSWIEAFCKYHRGDIVDQKGIRYAADVLRKIEEYDELYNLEFGKEMTNE